MIVMTISQKNEFDANKSAHQSDLNMLNIDFIPIEIKNNLYILPDSALNYISVPEYTQRVVLDSELIIPTPNGVL